MKQGVKKNSSKMDTRWSLLSDYAMVQQTSGVFSMLSLLAANRYDLSKSKVIDVRSVGSEKESVLLGVLIRVPKKCG